MVRWTDEPGGTRAPHGRALRRPSRRAAALLVWSAAALLAVAVVLTVRPGPGTAQPAPTTSAAPSSAAETPAPPTTPGPSTPSADPVAQRELQAVAAGLPPVRLSSPVAWDRWLPGSKPYPGVDTADDMSTCPRLTDRLEAVLGVEMSYWSGTLPQGPSGCTWVPVPLQYGLDPYDYAYLADVGFLSDGTTTEQMSRGFFHRQGQICPSTKAPAVGDEAFLVSCEELDGTTYVLALPDARGRGIWVLNVSARSDAAHPATDLLVPVIDGVVSAFG